MVGFLNARNPLYRLGAFLEPHKQLTDSRLPSTPFWPLPRGKCIGSTFWAPIRRHGFRGDACIPLPLVGKLSNTKKYHLFRFLKSPDPQKLILTPSGAVGWYYWPEVVHFITFKHIQGVCGRAAAACCIPCTFLAFVIIYAHTHTYPDELNLTKN